MTLKEQYNKERRRIQQLNRRLNRDSLTLDDLIKIRYYGNCEILGNVYTYKDYLCVSEIYRNGLLYARIDNRKAVSEGVEWV